GQQVARDYVWSVIERVRGRLDVEVGLPSMGRVSLLRQEAEKRSVLHLLYAVPITRGQGIQVIEDVVPLYDVPVSIRGTASRVSLAPSGEELPFYHVDGRIEFRVLELELHQIVVLDD
ncbi:beta-galactosidase, partial [bacterium]|nr:beta-galactosidase [bacterium]